MFRKFICVCKILVVSLILVPQNEILFTKECQHKDKKQYLHTQLFQEIYLSNYDIRNNFFIQPLQKYIGGCRLLHYPQRNRVFGQFYCEILIWTIEIFGKIFEKNRPFWKRDPFLNNIFPPIPKDFFIKRTFFPTLNLQMTLFLDYLSPKPLSFKGIVLTPTLS